MKNIFKTRQDGGYDSHELLETLVNLSEIFGFSLRTQEQCFTQLSIALQTIPQRYRIFPVFLAFLIALKSADRQLYNAFVDKQIQAEDVLEFIRRTPQGEEYLYTTYGRGLEAYIESAHADLDSVLQIISDYSEKAQDPDLTEKQRERYEKILSVLRNFREQDYYKLLEYLGKKIELIDGFVTSNAM